MFQVAPPVPAPIDWNTILMTLVPVLVILLGAIAAYLKVLVAQMESRLEKADIQTKADIAVVHDAVNSNYAKIQARLDLRDQQLDQANKEVQRLAMEKVALQATARAAEVAAAKATGVMEGQVAAGAVAAALATPVPAAEAQPIPVKIVAATPVPVEEQNPDKS